MCDVSKWPSVHVSLGTRGYEIAIVTHQFQHIADYIEDWMVRSGLPKARRKTLLVTDRNIASTHAAIISHCLAEAGWELRLAALEPGEPTKSLAAASHLYDQLVDFRADRQTCIIAVGGGVVGDLAGFVAATYARGLPFVQVPTTVLAQVDSSVGGKVGVNLPFGKNLVGAFYQPLGVFIDTSVLQTLPERDYRAGLAEVIKYGVILDAEFFCFLETHTAEMNRRDPEILRRIIARSCRLKADVVELDEFERTGVRAALNYGHTFAHAFEALSGYGELLHGEAVSIGMLCASRLAQRLGMIDATVTERQRKLLSAVGLPVQLPRTQDLDQDAIVATMQLDKKTVAGKLRFVLPTEMGHVEVVQDVPESDVRAVLADA